MRFRDYVTPVCLLILPAPLWAQQASPSQESALSTEYLEYEQRVHSASEGTELGDKARLDAAFRYQYNPSTYLRFRLEIDPNISPEENKSSKFELRLNHRQDAWEFQADFDLYGDDYQRGATTLGPDFDSDDSYIAYSFGTKARAVFYPYNFGGEVGSAFRTWDVTRIFYIDGTPTVIANIPVEDEKIRMKTLPGFVLEWTPNQATKAYVGVGSARFLYPAVEGFEIDENTAAERWKAKEDRGYKGGIRWTDDTSYLGWEGVRHENSAIAGAIMESAWSLQAGHSFAQWGLAYEHTQTKAGAGAYRLNKDGRWFQDTTPFRPIYSDYFGARQDWLSKIGAGDMVELSFKTPEMRPYLAVKHLSPYFLYRERESAQRLRTADESESHGGLNILALGVDLYSGNFTVRPELEFMQAKNAVFGNRTDIREDRILSSLSKKDRVLTLNLTYAN